MGDSDGSAEGSVGCTVSVNGTTEDRLMDVDGEVLLSEDVDRSVTVD